MEFQDLISRLAVALAIGLLIGLERGWRTRAHLHLEPTASEYPNAAGLANHLITTLTEQEFARTLQKEAGVPVKGLDGTVQPLDENPGDPKGGSSDVGDVSWNVPILHVSVATAPLGTHWHAWPVAACGGMSIGHKGMTFAAKTLAATMVDLFEQPAKRAEIRKEFENNTKDAVYKGYIPDGPPPLPAQ